VLGPTNHNIIGVGAIVDGANRIKGGNSTKDPHE